MATGQYVRPGVGNTYVRNHEATGRLIISFSRAPKSFPLAKWCQYMKVDKTTGLYLRIKAEDCARVLNSNLAEFIWQDGGDRPKRPHMEQFRFESYFTNRYLFPWQLGYKAAKEADWPVTQVDKDVCAQQAMTARAYRAATVLQTEGNWDATHVASITSIEDVSGYWEDATSSNQDIKKSLTYAVELIEKDTFGKVTLKDLQLVINPRTARRMGTCQEIIDFVKQQPSAPQILAGSSDWLLEQYGLPARLYGLPVTIDNTVRVSTRRGASTQTKAYVVDDGNAFILARPGSIEASAGQGPSFSTVMAFLREEMTVEERDDAENRRVDGAVIDDFDIAMTAPVSGYWFQDVIDTSISS